MYTINSSDIMRMDKSSPYCMTNMVTAEIEWIVALYTAREAGKLV